MDENPRQEIIGEALSVCNMSVTFSATYTGTKKAQMSTGT